MKYEKGNEVEISGRDLYIIDRLTVENKDYIYAEAIVDDDLTDDYFVYEIDDEPKLLNDQDKLAVVLKSMLSDLKEEMDMGE